MSDDSEIQATESGGDENSAILPARDLLAEKAHEYGFDSSEPDPQFEPLSPTNYVVTPSVSAYEQIKARQRRVERLTLGGAGLFVICLIAAYIFTDGKVVTDPSSVIRSISGIGGSIEPDVNCEDPRHARTLKCQRRKSQTEADWRNITRFDEGKTNPFAVHGKE